jgi:glycine/D-amino acid oxidase-like deaminating enzyme/nitrite reductase/ring-hydroxylating ferredoxin subunit
MPPESHRSIWLDAGLLHAASLNADTNCDVCIIGAGIAGLLIAERLAADGRNVIVIDAGPLAGGETARTTAHLVTALDDRFAALALMHGDKGARLAAQSHAAAIDHVERLVQALGVDCGWRRLDGYLTVGVRHHEKAGQLLDEELHAAKDAGLDVQRVEHLPRPWPALGPALRFSRQAQLHPLRFLAALARHLISRGVRIYSNTRATGITGGPSVTITTGTPDGPVITAAHAVVATNTPINTVVAVHTKQAGYQTYVIALRIPGGSLPPALMWDGLWEDDVSYHYVRLMHANESGDDLLIVGGEDHKTGQGPRGDEPYRCLEEWARANFPMCGAVERRWSGEVMEPADGLAYIGTSPGGEGNISVVTGDSGNGMTHAAVAAILVPELIAGRGRQHPWTTLYDPARKIGLHALKDYTHENLNTFAQYRDWLKRGRLKEESEIAPGRGAILTHGLKHLAVYKDRAGNCTRVSAVCPHLGGIVRWNDQEQTWDCPCHASRFDKAGKVIHGPANTNLTPE